MRPRKKRCIKIEPRSRYFKPQGIPLTELEVICLTDEELEAMKLKNIDDLEQIEAARKMKTSQSTFQRIITSAYKKVTLALVKGSAIKIHDNDDLSRRFFKCSQCGYNWCESFGSGNRGCEMKCPACGEKSISRIK